ncbi:MAG: ABC transporter substrate-binding protein [Hydrogenophaga sp.]|nr:ABC transporter substrate-binding protein [Hydrogenophaga sp.]
MVQQVSAQTLTRHEGLFENKRPNGKGGNAAQAADTIKLGAVAPKSGLNARYGAVSMHGAELAVKDINDAGGVNGM